MPDIEPENEKWDLVLRPRNKWYQIDLKSVWEYRDLILLFVRRDFLAAYKQTVLGPLWMLLQPLLTTLLFSLIFGKLANISTGGAPRLLFYMAAFVPWTYFSECLNKTATTFTGNASIFGKVYFPRLVTPISGLISNLFKYGVQLLLLIALYLIFRAKGATVVPNYHLIFFPFLLLLMAGFGFSIGLIISALTTKYRDLSFLVGIGVQFLMYGSSVVISVDNLGPDIKKWLSYNPMMWIIEAFRYATIGVGTWSWHGLLYATCVMLIMLVFAVLVFNRVEKTFMDTV